MKKSKKVWTSAVVVAAGKGTRMNNGYKQAVYRYRRDTIACKDSQSV